MLRDALVAPAGSDTSLFSVYYPQLAGLAAAGSQATVNAHIRDTVQALATPYLARLEDVDDGSMPSSLYVDYIVSLLTDRLLSTAFTVSSYASGAAHPNEEAVTLTYDLQRGAPIALNDLFTPGTAYLDTLSHHSVRALWAQAEHDGIADDYLRATIEEGTAPVPENFKCFTVAPDSLFLTFVPYQVGPYAWGTRRVAIPYAALRDVLKPDGLLERQQR